VGIGSNRCGRFRTYGPYVDAFVDGLEQTGEGPSSSIHTRDYKAPRFKDLRI
jgi:hypothetical protein